MKISDLIKKLGAFEPDGFPFISLYINAEANKTGREDFRVWLKKELKDLGRNSDEDTERTAKFAAAEKRINDYLENEADDSANGIAIFTSVGNEAFFEAMQLNVSFPKNELFTNDRPHIFPLARALDQNPKYAVLWADTNKADIYIFGGEDRIRSDNQADEEVENIQNQVTNKTQVGGWSQGRYQRHIENFHLQHAKEVVAELESLMREKDIDHFILCGDETSIMPVLRPQLSKELERKVVGTLNLSQYDSVEEIRSQTHEAMGVRNAVGDKEWVERVFDAAKAAARLGTLGVEDTLKALSNGQVQELVICSDIGTIEYNAGKVERILKDYAPGDDNSSVETLPEVEIAGEVADELITRAINTDAKIVFIEDESLLRDVGGVGAILRYNMNASASG